MTSKQYAYQPDYAVPPGWLIEEILEERGWKQADLAKRCDSTPKHISEIVQGKAPISPATAIQFERILGISASLLSTMETKYQLASAKAADREKLKKQKDWVTGFKIDLLVKQGYIDPACDVEGKADALLHFFGFGSIEAWENKYNSLPIHFRTPQNNITNIKDLAIWLRIGEREALKTSLTPFDPSRFKQTLQNLRGLTVLPYDEFIPRIREQCAATGVFMAVTPPIGKNSLYGAVHWINSKMPIIQLTMRYKSNDQFWFTFFHEAAHILFHSKKAIFIDSLDSDQSSIEEEANAFAADILIPKRKWNEFTSSGDFSKDSISFFANEIKIAPGIVVGRLQHEGMIPYNRFNNMKVKIQR
ncbi:MAG: ImmA/IrrE family metallo-endopeptidase [bacterium]|nr:ImmA/IrrE family metallo-endopeptidase [bacterium]